MVLRPAWVEISLGNLKHNVRQIRRLVGEDCQIMLPVKADGYGHGAIEVSKAGLSAGANQLAVSMLDEAIHLREADIHCPILILGWTPVEAYQTMIAYDVATAIYAIDEARQLDLKAKEMNKKAKVHIKVDTGMSRLGIMPDDKGLMTAKEILSLDNIEVEGIFSHLSKADEKDKNHAKKQLSTFLDFVHKLQKESHREIPLKHIANSAAVIDLPDTYLDMVRPGIIFYGQYPSNEVIKGNIDLKPILSLKAKVSRVQWLPKDTLISYGGTFCSDRPIKVATIPIGYADGYDRHLSNKGFVLFQGKYLPIVGRVCMDQFMVDATDCDINSGDVVTLIGADNGKEITEEMLAEMLGTIVYEISCKLSLRLPRIYC